MAKDNTKIKASPEMLDLMKKLDLAREAGRWKTVAKYANELDALAQKDPDMYRITLQQYLARLGMRPKIAKQQLWYKRRYSLLKKKTITPDSMVEGQLLFFKYKPETKGYWDFQPLVIYLGSFRTKQKKMVGIGLNLHYLPPQQRAGILMELAGFMITGSKNRIVHKSRMGKVTWEVCKKHLGAKVAKKLIHSYRFDRFQTAPDIIHPAEYANVVRMPLKKFSTVN